MYVATLGRPKYAKLGTLEMPKMQKGRQTLFKEHSQFDAFNIWAHVAII